MRLYGAYYRAKLLAHAACFVHVLCTHEHAMHACHLPHVVSN